VNNSIQKVFACLCSDHLQWRSQSSGVVARELANTVGKCAGKGL
jgi:hypothetical protein